VPGARVRQRVSLLLRLPSSGEHNEWGVGLPVGGQLRDPARAVAAGAAVLVARGTDSTAEPAHAPVGRLADDPPLDRENPNSHPQAKTAGGLNSCP
jgi:hypothetical protein